jgi:hypothetical protein
VAFVPDTAAAEFRLSEAERQGLASKVRDAAPTLLSDPAAARAGLFFAVLSLLKFQVRYP